MSDSFEIPVTYKGEDLCFKANVARYGYVHLILVDIFGTEVRLERDEEGNYRALVDLEVVKDTPVDLELVKAVIHVLQSR